jgi:hypothetical protein
MENFLINKRSVLKHGGDNQAPFFVIIVATLWAVNGITLRPILFNLPVSPMVLIESLIVALLLTPFMLRTLNVPK